MNNENDIAVNFEPVNEVTIEANAEVTEEGKKELTEMMNTYYQNKGLIGKDLERLHKKLVPSKSGLEPDESGNFPVDPTVTFITQNPYDRYPNWKLTTYIVNSEDYKKAMADAMNQRKEDKDPAHFTKDGKLKFIDIFDILEPEDYIAVGQDAYLSTIWLMWKNRQFIKAGNYKATKISKLLSDKSDGGKTDGGMYVDVVSIPESAWEQVRDYFYETVSEDGTVRIERLLDNGVEGQDYNNWLTDLETEFAKDMTEEQFKELKEKRSALLEKYRPIVKDIEEDLCGLYREDVPAIMSKEQLSEIDYQREINFVYHLMEKAQAIDDLYKDGNELMMVTYLDLYSFQDYCDYYEKTKGETVKGE